MWTKVEGASRKHVSKIPKIVPKFQPKVNIARISVENVCRCRGGMEQGREGREFNKLLPRPSPFSPTLPFPTIHLQHPVAAGGWSGPKGMTWLLADWLFSPGIQQTLLSGLPCPSSDSSWQPWCNVLLTAVSLN